jgi:hypothetical protein
MPERVRKNSRQSKGWEGIFGLSFSTQIAYYLQAQVMSLAWSRFGSGSSQDRSGQIGFVDKFSTEI